MIPVFDPLLGRLRFDGVLATRLANLGKQPSGLPSPPASTFSFDDTTRVVVITPTPSFDVQVKARTIRTTLPQGAPWTDVEGLHYFYFDSGGTLQHTTSDTVWDSIVTGDGATVAAIYWDFTNKVAIRHFDERHPYTPDGQGRLWDHEVWGMQWVDGGELIGIIADAGGGLDTHAQLGVAGTEVWDENLHFTFTSGVPQVIATPAQLPVFWLEGAGVWRRSAADSFPFVYGGRAGTGYGIAGDRIAWNRLSGGVWSLQPVGVNGDFVLAHVFATNDLLEPFIAIVGQAEYTTLALARTGATTEMLALSDLLDLLGHEYTPLGSVILQTSTAFANSVKADIRSPAAGQTYVDFRKSTFRGGVSAGITEHDLLSGRASGVGHPVTAPALAGFAPAFVAPTDRGKALRIAPGADTPEYAALSDGTWPNAAPTAPGLESAADYNNIWGETGVDVAIPIGAGYVDVETSGAVFLSANNNYRYFGAAWAAWEVVASKAVFPDLMQFVVIRYNDATVRITCLTDGSTVTGAVPLVLTGVSVITGLKWRVTIDATYHIVWGIGQDAAIARTGRATLFDFGRTNTAT